MSEIKIDEAAEKYIKEKTMWTMKDLFKHASGCSTERNGKWVPARPINFKYRSILSRLKEAWAVFTGKADAFTWPEGQ
jgi:hypothetical protein